MVKLGLRNLIVPLITGWILFLVACLGRAPEVPAFAPVTRSPIILPTTWTPLPSATITPIPSERPTAMPSITSTGTKLALATTAFSTATPTGTATATVEIPPTPLVIALETSPPDWKIVNTARFTLLRPRLLEVIRDGARLRLQHRFPYAHSNPCVGWGGPYCEEHNCDPQAGSTDLEYFTDFEADFEVIEKTITETMKTRELGYHTHDIAVGALVGSVYSTAIEGCGELTYLFPLEEDRTLLVRKTLIAEYNSGLWDVDYIHLPEVLNPEQESHLFYQVLASFELRK